MNDWIARRHLVRRTRDDLSTSTDCLIKCKTFSFIRLITLLLNLIWKNEKETDLESHELAIKSANSQERLHWNRLQLTKEKANLSICKIV